MSAEKPCTSASGSWPELCDLRARARDEDWLIDVEDACSLDERLGEGTTALAFSAHWLGAKVVVKKIKVMKDELSRRAFVRECSIMSRMRHPNVLAFYGASLEADRHISLVTEAATGGTLKAWLYQSEGAPLPQNRSLSARLSIAMDILHAFVYFETRKPIVLHRDLKPSNVFIMSDGRAVVADFGLARFVAAAGEDLTGETGTYIYMAPEVIKSQHYDNRADIFSFGVLLYEIATGIEPYQPHNSTGIQIARGVADQALRPKIPDTLHPALRAIIEMCWQQDANERPCFSNTLKSMDKMVPEILREEEAKLAERRANPSLQAKTFKSLSNKFASWSQKMNELAM